MKGKLEKTIGVLGGGQLGKMLCQAAHDLGINMAIMDKSDSYPAAQVTPEFIEGNFQNEKDVVSFSRDKDIITIEIENVNVGALHYLEKNGITVYPQPKVIDIIKDKGKQKEFYAEEGFPTSDFKLYDDSSAILKDVERNKRSYPFVQKVRTGGYDGKGVQIINNEDDLKSLLDVPSVVEELISIEKEIGVIVARNPSGEIKSYPPVEMEFHPTSNLIEFLFSPADLSTKKSNELKNLAIALAEKLEIVGILAVEFFIDKKGKIWINEIAPRPHNSGHHTIEANHTSQYEQHIRAILDLPLGDTSSISPAVMCNILGEEGYSGKATYQNLENCMKIDGAHFHIYGKETTSSFRKMGHVTILDNDLENAKLKAKKIKSLLKVRTSKK